VPELALLVIRAFSLRIQAVIRFPSRDNVSGKGGEQMPGDRTGCRRMPADVAIALVDNVARGRLSTRATRDVVNGQSPYERVKFFVTSSRFRVLPDDPAFCFIDRRIAAIALVADDSMETLSREREVAS
jgi:hypothetical protein